MTRGVRLALLAIVLAALVLTLSRLDAVAIQRALREMSWGWAAIAAAVNLLGVVVDASRWRIILSALRPVSIKSVLQAQVVGIAANVVFPFKLGEGARAFALATREAFPTATAVTTVLLDRVVDAATLPLFVGIASLLMPLPPAVLKFRGWIVVVLAASVVIVSAGRWWVRRRRRARTNAHSPIGRTIDRIVEGLCVLDHHHRLALTIAMAFLAWSLRAVIVWCMLRAFHLPLPISASVGVLALLNFGIAVVATPGNVGTFELVTVGALALWSVAPETGMGLAITMHALEVIPSAALGLAAIAWHRGALWPRREA